MPYAGPATESRYSNIAHHPQLRYSEDMKFRDWLRNTTSDKQEEIARKIGLSRRALQNQIYREPKIETIIKISEEYEVSPIIALTDLGFLDPKWMKPAPSAREIVLRSFSAEELAAEVSRRLLAAEKTPETTPDKPLPPQGEPPHGIHTEVSGKERP